MKVEIEKLNEEFTPFSMTFTFESIDEVREMWHRLNINSGTVYNDSSPGLWNYNKSDFYDAFAVLDNEMKRRNILP